MASTQLCCTVLCTTRIHCLLNSLAPVLSSTHWCVCHFSEKELNAFAETLLEIYQTHQKNDRQVGFVLGAFYPVPSKE